MERAHSQQTRPAPGAHQVTAPCVMVIFGVNGDLTKRKLLPALYNLAGDNLLSREFAIIGFGHADFTTGALRQQLAEDIKRFATTAVASETWDWFMRRIYYVSGSFQEPKDYETLGRVIEDVSKEHGISGNHFYYLAVAPRFFSPIVQNLGTSGLVGEEKGLRRVIIEKPFGRDLDSARAQNGGKRRPKPAQRLPAPFLPAGSFPRR